MFHLITDFLNKMDGPDRKDTRRGLDSHDLRAHTARARPQTQMHTLKLSKNEAIIS